MGCCFFCLSGDGRPVTEIGRPDIEDRRPEIDEVE